MDVFALLTISSDELYVIFYFPFRISLFDVIGCPLDRYGRNCLKSCPVRCNNSLCHIETGECLSCEDGYRGLKCEEGTY